MNTQNLAKNAFHLLLSSLIALSFVAAVLPATPALAADATCAETHTVKAGETIYRIAKDYDLTVNRLAKTNELVKPYTLTVGDVLCIPGTPDKSSNYSWTPTYNGSQVKITGSNFKKQYAFFVKARQDDTTPLKKLGKTVTSKTGTMDTKFSVPSNMRNLPNIKVCLKDGQTNFLDCRLVWRTS